VVNTVLDLFFVIVFDMAVLGVALATIIAQGLSAVLVVYVLMKEKGAYGLRLNALRIDKAECREIFRLGLPSSFQQGLTSFSNVFVMGYVNAFGADCTSGWGAYNKLDAFLMVPVIALAQASTTFVGQNWGAKQYGRAKKGVRSGVIMSMICLVTMAALVLLFANPLLHLITNNPAEIAYGERFIRIITPFYITICFNQMYAGALRGIGSAKTPMFIFLGSFVAFRQAFLFLVKLLVDFNVIGNLSDSHFNLMSLAFPMGWMMASTLLLIFYRRSKLFKAQDEMPAAA
jgi:Na+-driven multidrug efflux pump